MHQKNAFGYNKMHGMLFGIMVIWRWMKLNIEKSRSYFYGFWKKLSVEEGNIVVAFEMQQQYPKMLQQFRFHM
jgi:hypothetical protein